MKEPKDITYAEGKEAERMIGDVMVVPETPFVIEGIWSGKKSDMKYVDWERENSYNAKEEKTINEEEFVQMQYELKQAETSAVAKGFQKSCARDFWFETKGVIRLDIGTNFNTNSKYYNVIVKDPQAYVKFQDRLEAFEKKRFGMEKENERLERVAKEQGL